MKQTHQAKALILRSYPSGDYDLVYRLLSPSLGKVSAIAKSVRKSKRRFSSLPEPFDIGEAELREGKGELFLFNGFIPKKNFRKIRDSLTLFSLACTLCECFDYLTQEGAPESWPQIFGAAVDGLTSLNEVTSSDSPHIPVQRSLRTLIRLGGFLESTSLSEALEQEQEWNSVLDKIEGIVDRPIRSRAI